MLHHETLQILHRVWIHRPTNRLVSTIHNRSSFARLTSLLKFPVLETTIDQLAEGLTLLIGGARALGHMWGLYVPDVLGRRTSAHQTDQPPNAIQEMNELVCIGIGRPSNDCSCFSYSGSS